MSLMSPFHPFCARAADGRPRVVLVLATVMALAAGGRVGAAEGDALHVNNAVNVAVNVAANVAANTAVNTAVTAAAAPNPAPTAPTASWRTAPRHSAGLAPDPKALVDLAIVQVYAAATFGWRGHFAVHPWIIYKRAGDDRYTRYDVVGWSAPQVVRRNFALPDGLWYGARPQVLVDHRGAPAAAMIEAIEAAIASYPFADRYLSYPGPNSNTFLAHIGREVPALQLDLPANAIGKDYRPWTRPLGVSPTGSGVQVSLWGLLGLSVGLQEGVEVNLLGLNFGLDLNRPALRLPFIGRLGFGDRSESGPRGPGQAVLEQVVEARPPAP